MTLHLIYYLNIDVKFSSFLIVMSQQEPGPESDSESRHRRHKRDHRNGSRRSGDREELEDGEFGNVGESR